MKKNLILIVIIAIFLMIPTHGSHGIIAQVLKAGIVETWTLDKAKIEAFKNIEYRKNLNWAHAVDPNFQRNIQAINNNEIRVNNYKITTFYDNNNNYNSYAIRLDNTDISFYYNILGHLESISFGHLNKNYPTRSVKYNYPNGDLIFISLNISKLDSYLFNPNGGLIAHWVNNIAYDSHGNIIQRKLNSK